jgi:hypothetical protein
MQREYIQIQLTSPLVANHDYQITFYVSFADNYGRAINNLGAALTSVPLAGNGQIGTIDVIPQINSEVIVSNPNVWTQISQMYQATGGEQYLTIGNFYKDSKTNMINNVEPNLYSNDGYYYFDMVSVIGTALAVPEVLQLSDFQISPNPVTSEINLNFHRRDEVSKVQIHNSTGQLLYSNNISFEKIDCSTFGSGIYYITITGDNSQKLAKKFMKL